jgi:hypothetical protein
MPKSSRENILADWKALLEALQADEGRFAGAAPLQAALEKAYVETLSQLGLRNALAASTQEATHRLRQSVDEGREAASRLRALVKGTLGPRAQELEEFGIKPVRPRRFHRPRPLTPAKP